MQNTGREFDDLRDDVSTCTNDISRNFDNMGADVGESLAGIASLDAHGVSVERVINQSNAAIALVIGIKQYDALSRL